MAKEDGTKELNFAEKLGISMVEVSDVGPILDMALSISKKFEGADNRIVVPCLVGDSGIGKTTLVRQCAKRNDVACRIMSLASSESVDLKGLPNIGVDSNKNPIVEYVKQKALPRADRNEDKKGGILFLDELNRADTQSLQAVFAIISGELDDWTRPKGWLIVVAINPHDDSYQVKNFDPALVRRMSMVGVRTSVPTWARWAETPESGMNAQLVNFVRSTPTMLMDEVSLKNHRVFSNPASLEKVSEIINEWEEDGSDAGRLMATRPLIAGYIGEKNTDMLMKHISKASTAFDPVEIVHNYHKGTIREKFQRARSKRFDKVGVAVEAVREVVIGLTEKEVRTQQIVRNVADFVYDLPNELAMSFISSLVKAETDGRHSINWSAILYSQPHLIAKLDDLYDKMKAVPVAKK